MRLELSRAFSHYPAYVFETLRFRVEVTLEPDTDGRLFALELEHNAELIAAEERGDLDIMSVFATVYFLNREVGRGSLGGVEVWWHNPGDPDPYLQEVARDVVRDAVGDARRWMEDAYKWGQNRVRSKRKGGGK